MPLGPLPQNQLNALPLRTATDASAPDVATIFGNKITKYWGPTAAGIAAINFTADPELGSASAMFSSYLDLTGMNEFVAILVATIPNVPAADAVNVALRIQYRTPGGAVQPHSGTIGQGMFTSVATRTPNYGILVTPQTYPVAYAWSNSVAGASTIGSDVRLWFARDATLPTAGQLYNLHVWACQS